MCDKPVNTHETPGVARATYVTIGLTWAQILGADPNRRGLVLTSGPTNGWQFSLDSNPAGLQGIRLAPNSTALQFTRANFPGLVVQPLWAISETAAQTVAVVEEVGPP